MKGGTKMYRPSHFKIEDKEVIDEIIEQYSFATLISQHNGVPFATHLPLIWNNDHTYLYGHFARLNPQWKDIRNQTILAIFQGPHCYISPSWYETNNAVPTWNYVTVHVYGKVELLEDKKEVVDSLDQMVLKYEDPKSTYHLHELDSNFISGMSRAIQCFKIKINKIEGKAKLSQNHSVQRKKLIINQLEQISNPNEQQICSLMKANINN